MKIRLKQGGWSAKLIAAILLPVLLVLGIVGLVLPIVPGLLFLALAAWATAKMFPSAERWFRRSSAVGGLLDATDRFAELPIGAKARLSLLLAARTVLRGVAAIAAFGNRLFNSGVATGWRR